MTEEHEELLALLDELAVAYDIVPPWLQGMAQVARSLTTDAPAPVTLQ